MFSTPVYKRTLPLKQPARMNRPNERHTNQVLHFCVKTGLKFLKGILYSSVMTVAESYSEAGEIKYVFAPQ